MGHGPVNLNAKKNLSDAGLDTWLRFFLPLVVRMTAQCGNPDFVLGPLPLPDQCLDGVEIFFCIDADGVVWRV
jgi:hypothetical protein